ncbi:MAG TPA: hypothetical protein VF817_01635 [Patescibacteria group bacterium]
MKWNEKDYVIKCKEVDGIWTILEKKNYKKHLKKRPDVFDPPVFPRNITEALKSPHFTIPGLTPYTLCYYRKLYKTPQVEMFLKVITMPDKARINKKLERVHIIKSAIKLTEIKELIYGHKKKTYQYVEPV